MSAIDTRKISVDLAACGKTITNAPMTEYTSFKAGGPADILVFPSTPADASAVIRYCRSAGVPLTVIGGGSNLLIGDKGIRGVVMRIGDDGPAWSSIRIEDGMIYSDASVSKEAFIEFAVANGFSGVEFMAGVPGCVGGGILMNAGTFMGNFIDILKRIDYIDNSGSARSIETARGMAHYRGIDIPDCAVVTGALFSLPEGNEKEMREKIAAIIADRHTKHPWTYPSAGSVFKNPEGLFSWKLVNDSGLKGYRIGGAQVSELHTNFIINTGGASGRDIRDLIELVQKTVREKFGVDLHTEVRMIGEF